MRCRRNAITTYKLGKRHCSAKQMCRLFFYLLKIITIVMIKATFMTVKPIIPQNNKYIIEINADSIIDTTSLSQRCTLLCKVVNTHLLFSFS